jgi:hypothetical protein
MRKVGKKRTLPTLHDYKGISKKVKKLDLRHSTENEIQQLLEHRINYSLFDNSFDKAVKKVAS